ncbi:MAG: hypothetical protein U9N61_00230 [Euryarchaeota archaeon]|nr:hypothetical protein [Euryarchaeota archaeon]
MGDTRSIRMKIESLLVDLWEEGNRIGREDQKEEDETLLAAQLEDTYEKGYDKGYDKGYKAGLSDREEANK